MNKLFVHWVEHFYWTLTNNQHSMSDTTQDVSVADATIVPEVAAVPEVTPENPEVTPENPEPTPEHSPLDDLSEEELLAAIEAAIEASEKPTEPVSFPEPKAKNAELDSEIQALLKQKESELEEAKRNLQEKQSQSEQIESAWWMLNQALPDLPDILTKLVAWEEGALPIFYRKDFQERLQSDTVLWPLIDAHVRGEKPDYPGFIRSLAAAKMKSMPQTATAPKEPVIPANEEPQTPWAMLSRNKKTISLT